MNTRTILFFCFIIILPILFTCQNTTPVVSDDMVAEDYIQRAQNAMEVNNFELALNYYNLVKEKYPDDMESFLWASYKTAFIYHKMKNDEKALKLFNELLELYKNDVYNDYPQNPKILALNIMSNIEQAVENK